MDSVVKAVSSLIDGDKKFFKNSIHYLAHYMDWKNLDGKDQWLLKSFLEKRDFDEKQQSVLIAFLSACELSESEGAILVSMLVEIGGLPEPILNQLRANMYVLVVEPPRDDLVAAIMEREKESARMMASSSLKERQYPGGNNGMRALSRRHQAIAMRKQRRR